MTIRAQVSITKRQLTKKKKNGGKIATTSGRPRRVANTRRLCVVVVRLSATRRRRPCSSSPTASRHSRVPAGVPLHSESDHTAVAAFFAPQKRYSDITISLQCCFRAPDVYTLIDTITPVDFRCFTGVSSVNDAGFQTYQIFVSHVVGASRARQTVSNLMFTIRFSLSTARRARVSYEKTHPGGDGGRRVPFCVSTRRETMFS